jgi:hypothetical protein
MLSEGEKTIAYFKDLPQEAWETQVYTTGTCWNIKQVLAHFLSAERGLTALVHDIITEGGGAPEELDIDEFNENEVADLADHEIPRLLDAFGEARKEFSDLVGKLSAQDLDRMGRHPWFGETELRKALKLVYRHNMIHLRDIRKALDTGQPAPHLDIAPPAQEGKDRST